ncbi:hypothetical protein FRB94_007387 [Tulasnella sp. JGI-2019a]|nr:hypothetical protein FRB94_007387 [Tulasnella sp. JGI-2019a]
MDQLQKQLVDLQQSYSKLEMEHSELRIRLDEANHALTSERTEKLIQERELNERRYSSSTPNPGQGQADDPAVARPAVKIEEDDTSVLRVSLLEVCHLAF